MIYKVTSLQALLRKAFRSPEVLVLGDFGIFCLFLPRASREVKINRKCLTCLPKSQGRRLLGTTAILSSSMLATPSCPTPSRPTPSWQHLNVRGRPNGRLLSSLFEQINEREIQYYFEKLHRCDAEKVPECL